MRLAIVIVLVCVLGCGGNRAISPAEAKAIKAAETWLRGQGIEATSVELSAHPRRDEWGVLIEYQPQKPGAHTFLRVDREGNVIEVVPGA